MKRLKELSNVEYSYQLNCNEMHNMYFYINLIDKMAKLKIYKVINECSTLYGSYHLPFLPISCGWVGNNIFLQSQEALFLFRMDIEKILQLPFATYKILDMFILKNEYVYSTMIECDTIDFFIVDNQKKDEKISAFSLTEKQFIMFGKNATSQMKEQIKKYINKIVYFRKRNINDFWGEHKIKIINAPLRSKLLLDDEEVADIYGHIDRAYLVGAEVVYSFSSFKDYQQVNIINLKNIKKDSSNKSQFNFSSKYYKSGELGTPHYILFQTKQCIGNVLMIHGGPAMHYTSYYDPQILRLLLMGFRIYLINYTGSTGYGNQYMQKLFKNGGHYDYIDIRKAINVISKKYPDRPLFVIGDSYGGYLAILSLVKGENVSKVYATNAFTDIRYQYLFSKANSVIKKYFPDILSDEIRNINPIDLAKNKKLHDNLLIINGINDEYCPIKQICQFHDVTECAIRFLKDYPHFKVGYVNQKQINEIIIDDIRKMINA